MREIKGIFRVVRCESKTFSQSLKEGNLICWEEEALSELHCFSKSSCFIFSLPKVGFKSLLFLFNSFLSFLHHSSFCIYLRPSLLIFITIVSSCPSPCQTYCTLDANAPAKHSTVGGDKSPYLLIKKVPPFIVIDRYELHPSITLFLLDTLTISVMLVWSCSSWA